MIRLGENEIRSYEFRDLAGAESILIPRLPRLSRRLAAALDAHRFSQPSYVEPGTAPAARRP